MHTPYMSDTPRPRARQAELTAAHKRELSEGQTAIDNALEEVERRRKAYAKSAGRIADELGRGGPPPSPGIWTSRPSTSRR